MACNNCNKQQEQMPVIDRIKTVAQMPVSQIAKGIVGKVQTRLNVNISSDETIKKRIDVCRGCQYATRNNDPKFNSNKGLTSKSRCLKCTCPIVDKVRWAHSTCPVGLW